MDPGLPWNASLTGLRGFAVLLVMAFHLALPVTEGGPVGVILFFVLSGYLITRLLRAEVDATGSVDLPRFALRRARRLLPALLFAIAVTSLIAIAAGHGSASDDALLTLAYVANWARAFGDPMGLWNHAWSLAIEEQFYVIWPLVFVMVVVRLRMKPDTTVVVLLALAALSAALRATLTASGQGDRAYFGSDTRAEALLVGCALGVALACRPTISVPAWVGPAGLGAILILAVIPIPSFFWPGAMYSLAAIASCALLVGLERSRGGVAGLASRPLVWLGTRSYSLYLWHVPVILLIGPMLPASGVVRVAILAVVSLILAVVSYAYVEAPFRRHPDHRRELEGATRAGAREGDAIPRPPLGVAVTTSARVGRDGDPAVARSGTLQAGQPT
jgi:peptidoglycan/LPS O-acetylase OafA/YrhL